MIAFDQAKPLLKDGKDIRYQGQTGIGLFNKNNDPSSANIGVYTFDKRQQAGLRPHPVRRRADRLIAM